MLFLHLELTDEICYNSIERDSAVTHYGILERIIISAHHRQDQADPELKPLSSAACSCSSTCNGV